LCVTYLEIGTIGNSTYCDSFTLSRCWKDGTGSGSIQFYLFLPYSEINTGVTCVLLKYNEHQILKI